MQEIQRIEDMGVTVVVNHRVEDVLAEKAAGNFDAVFIAIGAGVGKHVDIPARDAGRVLDTGRAERTAARPWRRSRPTPEANGFRPLFFRGINRPGPTAPTPPGSCCPPNSRT